jgi:NRPS condensation-like uncharacterized protein
MNSYRVELLDEYIRLQEVTNDHQVRGVITFRDHLDIDKFKKSVKKSFNFIPVLRCRYSLAGSKALWEEINYSDDDLFSVSNEKLSQENIIDYLKRIPKNNSAPQIFIQIIRQDVNDVVIIILNHMAFDGTGFKAYLYLLSEIYSNNAQGETDLPADINMERRLKILLKNIPLRQKLFSLFRKTLNSVGTAILTGNNEDIKTRLGLFQINAAEFQAIKSLCKNSNITINDFILTLFCCAISGLEHKEKISNLEIQIMIDLRRYMKKYPVSQFGNFSSMESMVITNRNQSFFDLANEISIYMKKIKSHYPGIKNILMMDLLYKFLPRDIFNIILSGKIRSLSVSTSNLGVIDDKKLNFNGNEIVDAYMLTSIKNQPSMQLSFSTFKESITLSILGNYSQRNWAIIEGIMDNMAKEINELTSDRCGC